MRNCASQKLNLNKSMRTIFAITLILATLPSLSWSETINIDDLVIRDSLYFKKFTDVPFTGEAKITEETNPFRAIRGDGHFVNGKKDGFWRKYHSINGPLRSRSNYSNGIRTGLYEQYYKNGQLWQKGNYKAEKKDGFWKYYSKSGVLDFEGVYQKGVENGLWKFYHKNGQLSARIEKKNGWYDGLAEYFNEDGSLSKTETYEDGKLLE
ncbi:toxin-antitoxin system YwqK family antitoxin [Rhodobacteraceae bacterium]|nr:toxin-antitoxin system YwqK family antitoxin [Paracoccaceae bacterium]